MPETHIQKSLHGRELGLSVDNDLIVNREGIGGSADARAPVLSVARGQLTTGQLLAMNATPISVIAAPGATKAIIVDHARFFLDYNSAAYVAGAGEDLVLRYTDGSGQIVTAAIDGAGLPALTADAIAFAPGRADDDQGYTVTANAAVVAHILSGEWATGDSPINYEIHYDIIDITLPTS